MYQTLEYSAANGNFSGRGPKPHWLAGSSHAALLTSRPLDPTKGRTVGIVVKFLNRVGVQTSNRRRAPRYLALFAVVHVHARPDCDRR